MPIKWDQALAELAADRYPRLLGRAVLLCGDRGAAEDLVQEALVSALRTKRTFDSINQAEQYVRRAIASRYVDSVRSDAAARRRERDTFAGDVVSDPAGAAGDALDVASALRRLAPRERACVAMRYLEGLSTRETAEALGLSEGAVKRYLSDGIRALNALLGTDDSPDDPVRASVTPSATPKGGVR
ncbi:MAG: sigma-70 family RNA polymerase sigma factor [Demequina sp.]